MKRVYLLRRTMVATVALLLVALIAAVWPRHHHHDATSTTSVPRAARQPLAGYPGMPAVVDPANIYSEIGAGHVPAAHRNDPPRIYVPNGASDTVSEIDPATRKVVRTFRTQRQPQHIVPSYDLSTLWLLDNLGNALVPIDPKTGDPGQAVKVDDPYNLYFTPDGASAIVVAEARRRLDFRDPHTMALQSSLDVPTCHGMNHADYSADGGYALLTCEYGGKLVKVDIARRKVLGTLDLAAARVPGAGDAMAMRMPDGETTTSMPQDVRASPDGRHFYVADMLRGGVFVVDGDTFRAQRFVPTGVGAHGLTPSRDGTVVYVANRGSDRISGAAHGPGSVSVLDVATGRVVATWAVPGGGSPDMGNLSADGTQLWLSGRFDGEVYEFDTVHGGLAARIKVGSGPHGLTVWPQAGRYSLGHTGNMR
jgi:YVTN family beta-propeller protein